MKILCLSIIILTFFGCSTTTQRSPADYQSCLDIMAKFIDYRPISGNALDVFSGAKTFSELEEAYGGESLIDLQRNVPNAEIKLNNENIKNLANTIFKVEKEISGKKAELTMKEAETLYQAMAQSTVNKNHSCYDNKGTIGFCFGRATIAHMEAIIRDVHPESIKKIWIAGDMGVWGHHVATMVYTEKGWIVLDTNIGKGISVNAWIDRYMVYKKKDAPQDIMVFVTQAGRYGPYDTRSYNPIDLFNTQSADYNKLKDYYNGYFHDYFEDLDKTVEKIKLKPTPVLPVVEPAKPQVKRWWQNFF